MTPPRGEDIEIGQDIEIRQDAGAIPPREVAPARPSLKRMAITGSMWTMGGEFYSQGLRWAGNVVLARILAPEAFGLMMIVTTILIGLQMFSDVGIGPSIVQHKRGDDRRFLNTAFTIQSMRGVALGLASVALAWPLAVFYENPMLMPLTMFAGLMPLIQGFTSTSLSELHRRVRLDKLAMFEMAAQTAQIGATILLALWLRSVWALIIGGVVGAIFRLAVSHVVLATSWNQFAWDRPAVGDLIRFGRWIFIATAATFVVGHGDRLVIGKYFESETDWGLYAIAAIYATMPWQMVMKINSKVMFPLYARIVEDSPETLRPKLARARLTMMLAAIPAVCFCVIFGDILVRLLYTEEYYDAGRMLQILAAGGVFATLISTCSPVLLAAGNSFRHMLLLIWRSVALVGCMAVGGWLWGQTGLLIGVAAAPVATYPVMAWAVHRYRVWMPGMDAAFVAAAGAVIAIGLWIVGALGAS